MTRFRKQGLTSYHKYTTQTFSALGVPDGPAVLYDDGLKLVGGSTEEITDVATPLYKVRRRRGDIIMNPLVISKRRYVHTDEHYRHTGSNGTYRLYDGTLVSYWADAPLPPTWYPSRIADAKQRTVTESYSKIARSEVQSLVTVVEAGKTASMLARPFEQARGIIADTISRKARYMSKGLNVSRAAAAAWLETRFGWKPVLYDIQNIQNAYAVSTRQRNPKVRLVSRSSEEISCFVEKPLLPPLAPYENGARLQESYSGTCRVSSGVIYDLMDNTLADTAQRGLGLRLDDVASSIWELVPYSFVVDRFLSVGTWLQAISPKTGVTILGSWCTTKEDIVKAAKLLQWCLYSDAPLNYQGEIVGGGEWIQKIFNLTREVGVSPTAYPSINPMPISLQQTVDHYALVFAALVGIKVPKR